jgi:CysZ protein
VEIAPHASILGCCGLASQLCREPGRRTRYKPEQREYGNALGVLMIAAAQMALREILSPQFRRVFWKALALTIGLLAALWILLTRLLSHFVEVPWPWADTGFTIVAATLLLILMGFLVAPVTSLFAGLYLDDIAELVERGRYPTDSPGEAMPLGRSLATTAKFTLVVLAVNLAALPLVLFLGFGFVVFLVANAYLLGREYFELVALRFHNSSKVQRMRKRYALRLFLAGLTIAGLLAIPIANLLTPLFATAFMVHVYKKIAAADRRAGRFV